MFKALFIALAAAASWTVSAQTEATPEPTSPLPMLSMQGPEAAEAAPVSTVGHLRHVDSPKMVKLQKPKKTKDPKQVKVQRTEKTKAPESNNKYTPRHPRYRAEAKKLRDNAHESLLHEIELLKAENSRLQNALENKRDNLREIKIRQYEQRARDHKNDRMNAEHQKKAQAHLAEARALSDEARALRLERRAPKQAARTLEHREMALEARKLAAIAQSQAAELVEVSRAKALAHRGLAEEAALIEIEAQKLHQGCRVDVKETDGSRALEVHVRKLIEACEKEVEGCDDEIEILVEGLEEIGELFEVHMEGLGDIHELSLEGIDRLAEVLELQELSEAGELIKLQELGELFEGGELADLKEVGTLKRLLEGAEGNLSKLEGLGQLKGLQYLIKEQDCCDEDDEGCCDDEQDCEVSQRDFFTVSGQKPRRIAIGTADGQAQHVYFGDGSPDYKIIDLTCKGDSDCQTFEIRSKGKSDCGPFKLRSRSNSKFPGFAPKVQAGTSRPSFGWTTSTLKNGPAQIRNSVAPSGKGCPDFMASPKTSCGTSIINIDNNGGGQIFIDTQNGKTQIDCGSGSSCAPTPAVQGRVLFSTTCPPAPPCPPAPKCETPAKSNTGVSMGIFPRASIMVPTAVPAPAAGTQPEAAREYVFASQNRTQNATLAELERMLSEILREVDALQIEVDRVRNAVNKNQDR
ncbi:MAG: hypothetical protein GY930_08730 [bacterium]|nr:hypothetical protein [bacterium]